jgi:hypothetical protein
MGIRTILCALTLLALETVTARKSYIIKEKINSGDLIVSNPRVMAYDCSWCFFKDKNNDFCVSGDLNWKLQAKTAKNYQEAQVLTIMPHYKHSWSYETVQSGTWFTQFNLKKLFWNTLTY